MQFIDLKAQYAALKSAIDTAIQGVLDDAGFILGREVGEFEQMLCDYTGVGQAITCANGTDALQMVFMAYGIGRGDAIFCPDVTFIASVEPACMLGATPVFCDIRPDTYNLCERSLERQIQSVLKAGVHKPRAVIAVDFLGNPCDYDAIKAVCDKYNLLLIEDAAQSFGAEYKGQKCCSFGDIATTSFFPAKPLGCYGDGGAIFTSDAEMAELLKSIRVHGKGSSKYDNVRVGVNSRLDTIQAAILKVKLEALREYEVQNRQEIAARYNKALADKFVTPYVRQDCVSAYAQYALLAPDVATRDGIVAHLDSSGIPNMVYYPTPQHRLKVFEGNPYLAESFSTSEDYCGRTFSLPFHPYLTAEEQDSIIEAVLEVL